MKVFETILLVSQLVLFTLFMANVGNLIIHLLIKDHANNQFIGAGPFIYWINPSIYLNQNNFTRLNKILIT